jgi:hypothetical protein
VTVRLSRTLAAGTAASVLLTAGLASAQATATEDVEVAKPAQPKAELPWFTPPPGTGFMPPAPMKLEDPAAAQKRKGLALGVNLEPTFFVGDNARGASPALGTFVRFTSPAAGVDLGYMALATRDAFAFGATFVHFAGEVMSSGPHHLYILFPEVDLRFMTDFDLFMDVAPGGSLTGVRYGVCLGSVSLLAEVRGPTGFAHLPMPLQGNGTVRPFASTGFGMMVGVGF